ncbi:hypothetical protein HGI30_02170 [Paenibacillus albicereus]|uniref:Uncharacterized protein n=1 Tax=Paenibacillus albicereus TaxID=2726185 RepID=A0A6H2GSV9_9BACL|nr:hypothetical protein [Paenibacillus albicereus]QJC50513.1 hypothetical protein HGI30_02170 [Paenibacillus albicereus]
MAIQKRSGRSGTRGAAAVKSVPGSGAWKRNANLSGRISAAGCQGGSFSRRPGRRACRRAKHAVSGALVGALLLAAGSLGLLRYGLTHADAAPWDHDSPLAAAGLGGLLLFSGGALALGLARAWMAVGPLFHRNGRDGE